MIAINKVNQLYGGTQILWDLEMNIAEGSCTCIMGRNGVGKTTLLKCLMGLLPIKNGQLLLDGADFTRKSAESRAHSGIGYVQGLISPKRFLTKFMIYSRCYMTCYIDGVATCLAVSSNNWQLGERLL